MRGTTALVTSFLAFTLIQLHGQQAPPTLKLPDTAAPNSYNVQLSLDPGKPTFSGEVSIKLNIKQPLQTLWLNGTQLEVQSARITAGGKTYEAKPTASGDDFLGFQFDSQVPAGNAEMRISYTGKVRQQDSSGIFAMTDNGNKYIFTQFESTDARAAFPCFDEPAYKVPWQVTLTMPEQYTAVSNTPVLNESSEGGNKVIAFRQTKPLPSYLVAFAVGQLDFVPAGTAGRNHIPVRIVTPKGHAEEAKYAAEVTATILTRLEDYFGIPFPYEKSDQVAIPVTFGFGAMENAGMVTYGQTIILANPARDTETRRREYASVAAHELAHQWFGDLVTTEWWNDIWLNEAFATWTEQKILAEWKPEWKTRVEDVMDSKMSAEQSDSLVTARKIRQEIKSKDDISNAFDNITYQKGASVIRMFETWMGPEQFRKGVQSYLKQYAFRNATAPEFLDAISSASGKNVTAAFSTFLNQPGVPLVSVKAECSANAAVLHLSQQRYLPLGTKGNTDQTWQIPVCVNYPGGSGKQSECTLMTQTTSDWTLKAKGCPAWVNANDNAVGYYLVDYDAKARTQLTEGDVQHRLNSPERVDFIGNAQLLANGGKLPAADALKLVDVFHNDPERYVISGALEMALFPRQHMVPAELTPNYERFLKANFDARAREIGWVPKPGESDDVHLLRPQLLRSVATYAQDEELAKQARELTDKWFTDRNAVDPSVVTAVLGTAAYYGDKALFERFLAKLEETQDKQERQRIIGAMARFRDRAAVEAGMEAVLSGKVPFMEGLGLLFSGQLEPSTRMMAFEFMKAHFNEIAAKRPTGGGFDAGAVFPEVGVSYCSAQEKQQLQDFFQPRVDKFTGAPRALSQVLESIDVCEAFKRAEEPSVEAFLKNY
ncbi:MAG TPA: M1 family metallopeptidase [Bryobacteraceae bacterium]|nr:M1 family metallopeptidase [Bryobacteraceae bacterium]